MTAPEKPAHTPWEMRHVCTESGDAWEFWQNGENIFDVHFASEDQVRLIADAPDMAAKIERQDALIAEMLCMLKKLDFESSVSDRKFVFPRELWAELKGVIAKGEEA